MEHKIKACGFSLIEVVVSLGLISMLISTAVFMGLPEYNRYVFTTEKDDLIDALNESRVRTYAENKKFDLDINGQNYCVKDENGSCITAIHVLPSSYELKVSTSSTSTKLSLASGNLQSEINIDEYGSVDYK